MIRAPAAVDGRGVAADGDLPTVGSAVTGGAETQLAAMRARVNTRARYLKVT
jgi:hypothetical protein